MNDAHARQIVERLVSFEDSDAVSRPPQQCRGQHSGRPIAGDQHVITEDDAGNQDCQRLCEQTARMEDDGEGFLLRRRPRPQPTD